MEARPNGPIAGILASIAKQFLFAIHTAFSPTKPARRPLRWPLTLAQVVMAITFGLHSASTTLAQYAPGSVVYGQAPMMGTAGYGQPVPSGILLGSPGTQGQPVLGQPMPGRPAMGMGRPMGQRGLLASQGQMSANVNDPASMVPRLPLNENAQAASPAAAASSGPGAGQSENFIVLCRDPQLAAKVSSEAERLRRDLAVHWLGAELPPWSRRCPIQVTSGPKLGAGGETRFALYNGNVGDWQMSVQGTPERILDSVLPHEITHTILASHFAPLNVHVPRWADEGACTTVEHSSEQNKHKKMLVDFLRGGRALPFNRMFTLKDYPDDILPLYAQGHSVVEFLIAQSGPREFVSFLHQGMQTGVWDKAVRDHYGYETLGQLQIQWNKWIAAGRGEVGQFAGRPGRNGNNPAAGAGEAAVSLVSSQASAQNRGQATNVAEGSSVSLGNFTNISSQSSQPGEVNLTASNAVAREAVPASGGFYRQRLENNLRDGQGATKAASNLDAAVRGNASVLR